jgi:16S rRNA (uracil1498-N3)-methyltransferase
MNRFFIEKEQIDGDRAVVYGEDAKHISTVLRLKQGGQIVLCDGEGTDYQARIARVEKDRIALDLLSSCASEAEPRTKVTLFQGLPKAGKLESIIQKSVELGVAEIVPFAAKRSVVRLSKKEFSGKLERYRRVAYEAAKQSGRGTVPGVSGLADISEIDPISFELFLLPYEQERGTTLKEAIRSAGRPKTIGVSIGPEGGFEPEEAELLKQKGAVCVTLSRRILRTETAGPAVLAMLLYELEGDA